jgi:hypothetical protein
MSLFGGDGSSREPSLSQENESVDSDSLPRSPAQSSTDSFETAQNAQLGSYDTADQDDDDGEDSDDEENELIAESEKETPAAQLDRPNRFTGKPSTWKGYTEEDRQTAASLAQIESGDLSAHLYNAHALKRRVRLSKDELNDVRTWQSKEAWIKKGEDLEFTDILGDVQTELVPSKRWTAWPLPAQDIPGPKEKFWQQRGAEGTTRPARGLRAREAGTELREELLAVFLRLSKENWNSRKPADESHPHEDEVVRDNENRSRSKSANSQQSQTSDLDPGQDESEVEMQDSEIGKLNDDPGMQSESEQKFAHLFNRKKRGRKPSPPSVKATVLADDDRARRLLQPTINSLLTQVDGLASGIRRTRMNHFGRGAYSDTSGSEAFSDAESIRTRSRSRSRSTTRAKSTAAQKRPSKQTKRPLRDARPLDNDESGSDFGTDFGMERHATRGSSGPSTPRGRRARSKSVVTESSPSAERKALAQFGLMDWSEVLGIASVTGWNERAVARTAQRCASLFGEGMAFRSFNENLAMSSVPEPIQYTPSTIPGSDILGISDSSTSKRPFFDTGTLRCPHTDCWGHREEFPIPYRVIEHVKRVHGYDPRTNNPDNEERKYGGVHLDGFLQPITAKQGWMGRGRTKSKSREPKQKRRRKVIRENDPSSPITVVSSPS